MAQMTTRVARTACLLKFMRRLVSVRTLVIIIGFVLFLIILQLATVTKLMLSDITPLQKTKPAISSGLQKNKPDDLKYILLWTDREYAPFNYFGEGQGAFIEYNCSMINCFVTDDRNLFNGDVTKFDAVAFNGRNMKSDDLPTNRSVHQKYIYSNMESADNYPVCNETYDGFFNWTSTYKLNSDIPLLYILARNSNGEAIGPKKGMVWIDHFPKISENNVKKLANKSKAAAWFVSHCTSRSGRQDLVDRLKQALAFYKHTVDVYGWCGPLDCPREKKNECFQLLDRDYFFYMSLENSFAEDYVTEKLLTALQHDIVPIIYGGADYDRFLPPGSYLDARKHNVYELATIMDRIMSFPKLYQEFFRWKGHVIYSDPFLKKICNICTALNDKGMVRRTTVYHEFRKWWNSEFHERCQEH